MEANGRDCASAMKANDGRDYVVHEYDDNSPCDFIEKIQVTETFFHGELRIHDPLSNRVATGGTLWMPAISVVRRVPGNLWKERILFARQEDSELDPEKPVLAAFVGGPTLSREIARYFVMVIFSLTAAYGHEMSMLIFQPYVMIHIAFFSFSMFMCRVKHIGLR